MKQVGEFIFTRTAPPRILLTNLIRYTFFISQVKRYSFWVELSHRSKRSHTKSFFRTQFGAKAKNQRIRAGWSFFLPSLQIAARPERAIALRGGRAGGGRETLAAQPQRKTYYMDNALVYEDEIQFLRFTDNSKLRLSRKPRLIYIYCYGSAER